MTLVFQIIFALIAVWVLGSALLVVTARQIRHAILWFCAMSLGIGAFFLLLEAEFLATVQILIFGAALVLLLWLGQLRIGQVAEADESGRLPRWWLTVVGIAAAFGLLIIPVLLRHVWSPIPPSGGETALPIAGADEIGTALVREYLFPFEITALLLLVVVIGSVLLFRRAQPAALPTVDERGTPLGDFE